MRLDDPLAAARFTAEEVEFWRDAGIYYIVPCVSNEPAIAVLVARPPRERRAADQRGPEPLSRPWPGRPAIAIENGRLYRQLHLKASELDRLRAFNENILESLDDGLLVLGLDDRVIRWNQALERLYGLTRVDALGQPLDRLFDAAVVDVLLAQRRDASRRARRCSACR